MKLKQHIVIDPPTSDARRERVERKLFEQLAAVRMVERAEAVIPPAKKRRLMPMWIGAGALAAAAILAFVLFTRGDSTQTTLPSPSRVVTPLGGTTQFTVPGALIEAQSDTSVEVHHGANGAITLDVKRGAVECNVEHRENRPPFKVVAGEVSVEVVGTIFTVTKTPNPRVDVARGTVRVTFPGGTRLVEAGETWPATQTAALAPEPVVEEPVVVDEPVAEKPEPVEAPAKKKAVAAPVVTPEPKVEPRKLEVTKEEKDRAKESYRIANKLEQTDPARAAVLYRSIATDGKGMEPVALLSLAEVELKLQHPAQTLAALDELKQRFPKSANAEEAAWLRYKALTALGKRDEARGAADEYLRQFPNGAYAERLRAP